VNGGSFTTKVVLDLIAALGLLHDDHAIPDTDEDLIPDLKTRRLDLIPVEVDLCVVVRTVFVLGPRWAQLLLSYHGLHPLRCVQTRGPPHT